MDEYNVLVVGQTGTGKSTVCNKLTGRNRFRVYHGLDGQTTELQTENRFFGNSTLKIFDTPALENLGSEVSLDQEITKWTDSMPASGPDAVLFVVRCDVLFTYEEYQMYEKLRKVLGSKISDNLIIAFTRGEFLEEKIDVAVTKAGNNLDKVFKAAQGRHLIFRSNDGQPEHETQVSYLVAIVADRAKARGKKKTVSCFRVLCYVLVGGLVLGVLVYGHLGVLYRNLYQRFKLPFL